MRIQRGDVVLLNMPFAQGGGSKTRPALVVQADANNARIDNTIVAAITRNLSRVHGPTQLLIEVGTPAGRQSGLLADSAVTCENLFTVHRNFLIRIIGSLPADHAQSERVPEGGAGIAVNVPGRLRFLGLLLVASRRFVSVDRAKNSEPFGSRISRGVALRRRSRDPHKQSGDCAPLRRRTPDYSPKTWSQ